MSDQVKKVRMTPEEVQRLARVAKELAMTESEVLRQGVLHVEKDVRRRKAIMALVKMAEEAGPEPPKIYWEGR